MGTDTGERVCVEPRSRARARVSSHAGAPRNLDLTARTYLDARTASLDAHPSTQNAIWKDHLCHIPIAKEPARQGGETPARRRDATHDARRDTTHDARRAAPDDYWCSRRPASGGTSSHARTQLRLASPRPLARTHARTKRIRFPGWTHPPTSDSSNLPHPLPYITITPNQIYIIYIYKF